MLPGAQPVRFFARLGKIQRFRCQSEANVLEFDMDVAVHKVTSGSRAPTNHWRSRLHDRAMQKLT